MLVEAQVVPFVCLRLIRSAICAATEVGSEAINRYLQGINTCIQWTYGYSRWNQDHEILNHHWMKSRAHRPTVVFLPAEWDMAHNETFLGMSQRVSSGSLSTSGRVVSTTEFRIWWASGIWIYTLNFCIWLQMQHWARNLNMLLVHQSMQSVSRSRLTFSVFICPICLNAS